MAVKKGSRSNEKRPGGKGSKGSSSKGKGSKGSGARGGKLKIGSDWNAIRVIALSQTNPLKAIAEFVENSIDAHASEITLVRGKEKGSHYLKVIDNGDGIEDFKYVATHIADSIKRKMKEQGADNIQGEFGIGLLSFWTVGEELSLTSAGSDGVVRRMKMERNNPGYSLREDNRLLSGEGTELLVRPILPGVRQLTGEKIQNYLASELRERINRNKVLIKILDRTSRKELVVEPHKFSGRLLHHLPKLSSPMGEIYHEIYLSAASPENRVALYKNGTRVLPSISSIDYFNCEPWTSGYLTGILDASFLQLTPGTRDGIVYDEAFESFAASLEPLTAALSEVIEEQKRAEEEKASHRILNRISKALKEALSYLPDDEYGWLDVAAGHGKGSGSGNGSTGGPGGGFAAADGRTGGDNIKTVYMPGEEGEDAANPVYVTEPADETKKSDQKEFFDYPGPLYKASVSPAKAVLPVGETKRFSVTAKDRKGTRLDSGFTASWEITDGAGEIDDPSSVFVEYTAPLEPCVTNLGCVVSQEDTEVLCEALITVTAELGAGGGGLSAASPDKRKKGLPGYTYRRAPGELWRSRYDDERYIIIINNGHTDFIYASRNKRRKLKYIAKLFAKELILANFPEARREQALERMIELQLYTEENL